MRTASVLLATVCLFFIPAACPLAQAGEPGLWQYVHPDTRFLAGLDWARARNSATGRMLVRRMTNDSSKLDLAKPALEALNMVDRVLISGSVPDGDKAQPKIVVALEGRFDRAAVKRLMPPGTASERYKGYDLLVPPRSRRDDMLLAVVNDRLAIAGPRAELLRVLAAPAPLKDTALVTRATLLAIDHDLWLTSSVSAARTAAAFAPHMKQFDEIESLELGISLQRGLALDAQLTARTEDDAKALATFAQLGLAMAGQGKGQPADVAALLRGVTFKIEGRVVHAGFDITLAQLERGMTSFETRVATLANPLQSRPASDVERATAPPPARTIRIVGAEGGEREIRYSTPQQ